MVPLADDRIRAVHAAAISARLDRMALLAPISRVFSLSLPTVANPSEQVLVDLHYANEAGALVDGSVPLILWLETAVHLAGARRERLVFEEALAEARATPAKPERAPTPSYRDAATRALGEELERERARQRALDAAGAPADAVRQRILEIRRKLREGGQLREGDTLGRWTLLEPIGRGGFAVVWKAFDPERKAIVAVKVLHANLAGDPIRRDRFFRGARAMAGLDHAAIVKVLAPAEEDEGFHFFVMEHIEGEDLQHAVVKGHFPRSRALPIVLAVGEALAMAHTRGLIHRDVKPANILIGPDGEPKLTDFDLVGAGDTTGGTRTGALGTFLYSAPESLDRPQDADARVDVFGLAMTAVFALHGQPLPQQEALRHTNAFVDGLVSGKAVKEVLKRALDWDRDQRFDDVRAFSAALKEAIDAEPPSRIELVDQWVEQGEDGFGRFATLAVGGVVQRMRWIPPASFLMGSLAGQEGRFGDESPPHEVELTRGYWLGETPCTQALWQAVMGSNPSRFKSPDRPVESVSWDDCQAFLQRLAARVPWFVARLPTEAEWEHACRAGTTGETWAGAARPRGERDAPHLDAIAWYGGNSGVDFDLDNGEDSSGWPGKQYRHTRAGTNTVGKKQANPFGLHDMLGNVWEWCEDWFGSYAAARITDPRGAASGHERVLRGGAWSSLAWDVRAASRLVYAPSLRFSYVGFRLARGRGRPPGAAGSSAPSGFSGSVLQDRQSSLSPS